MLSSYDGNVHSQSLDVVLMEGLLQLFTTAGGTSIPIACYGLVSVVLL